MGTNASVEDTGQAEESAQWIHRTSNGWQVADTEMSDLLNAMVLADLMLEEQGAPAVERTPPPRADAEAPEVERLRTTVAQLEHALHTRVVVEQAIGVLAERHDLSPRDAFNRLRHSARSRGRKVSDLARRVVNSCRSPLVPLPAVLAREGSVVEAD